MTQRVEEHIDLYRRMFLGTMALSSVGIGLAFPIDVDARASAESGSPAAPAPRAREVSLEVDGARHALHVEPRTTLLDALREQLHLSGVKKGCDRGQCGACTVLANGRRINSCLTLAVMHDGEKITTVQGLAQNGGKLSALQAAFLEHDGFQCGFCTPGQLCAATALLDEVRAHEASAVTADLADTASIELSDAEIRERLSGNICRCGAYPNIVAAVRAVAASA